MNDNFHIMIFPAERFVNSNYEVPDHLKGTAPVPLASSIQLGDINSWDDTMDQQVAWVQKQYRKTLRDWQRQYNLKSPAQDIHLRSWTKDGKLVVPPDLGLKRRLMHHLHDGYTAGHPGRDKTIWKTKRSFWWPNLRTWVEDYVKGCTTCQQGKILTHQTKVPLYRIPTTKGTLPFQTVTMDLIIGLPPNGDLDSILTLVDHGCSHAALFLPCVATITGPKIAQLYLDNIYRWFSLPSKMISD